MKPKILFTTILSIFLFTSCGIFRTKTVHDPRTHDEGVVINGIRWATRNVDAPGTFAPMPESPGMLYQWNRKVAWNTTDREVEGWDNSLPEGTKWYAENDPCPEGWRVPTREELQSLYDSGSVWVTYNEIRGRLFGTAPNQIFLPLVGWRLGGDGSLLAVGATMYRSSTQFDSEHATSLGFFDSDFNYHIVVGADWRPIASNIRCVAK